MSTAYPEPIIHEPIATLATSEKFKEVTKRHGLETLADLLQFGEPTALLQLPGFDEHLLVEYTRLLKTHQLTHYLI